MIKFLERCYLAEDTPSFKSLIKKALDNYDFDEIEYVLDNADPVVLGTEKAKVMIKLLQHYSDEFEFWEENKQHLLENNLW